jgi:hypothetical protein
LFCKPLYLLLFSVPRQKLSTRIFAVKGRDVPISKAANRRQRAVNDPAFVGGIEDGFPRAFVSDASTTLTLFTKSGAELFQEVTALADFDGPRAERNPA